MDFSGGAQTLEMERIKLVFFDRKKQFYLEDLLRASAEMLEKGSFGTAYKVVLNDGCVVAVKKLSQKADVYIFGVLLLEFLTGKAPMYYHSQEEGVDLPKWVHSIVREEWTAEVFDLELMRYKNIEEEMVSMLQIALSYVV